MTRRNSS